MKKVNVSPELTAEINVLHAQGMTAGHGHKKITVEVEYNGQRKQFSATTNNMPDWDAVSDLEGQDKYDALYDLVGTSIEEQVAEWIYFIN